MPILLSSGDLNSDPTLGDLVEETITSLQAWSRNQEQTTWLTATLADDGLTMTVDDADQLGRGLCEIGYEQVYLSSLNTGSSSGDIAPFGRGYNQTVAEQHEVGEKVIYSPLFPKIRVAEAINQTVASLRGRLFVVDTLDLTFTSGQLAYTLPDDAERVLGVEQQAYGVSGVWMPVLRWRHNTHTPSGFETGTNSIDLLGNLEPDSAVRVTYTKYPTLFSNTDEAMSVTGLDESARDILVLGASSRLVAFIDSARLNVSSVAADIQDTNVSVGSAAALSRYLYQLFSSRVDEERTRLLNRHNQYVNYPGA